MPCSAVARGRHSRPSPRPSPSASRRGHQAGGSRGTATPSRRRGGSHSRIRQPRPLCRADRRMPRLRCQRRDPALASEPGREGSWPAPSPGPKSPPPSKAYCAARAAHSEHYPGPTRHQRPSPTMERPRRCWQPRRARRGSGPDAGDACHCSPGAWLAGRSMAPDRTAAASAATGPARPGRRSGVGNSSGVLPRSGAGGTGSAIAATSAGATAPSVMPRRVRHRGASLLLPAPPRRCGSHALARGACHRRGHVLSDINLMRRTDPRGARHRMRQSFDRGVSHVEQACPCHGSRRLHRPPPDQLLVDTGYWVRGADVKQPEYEPTDADEFEVLDLRDWENCLRGDARRRRGLPPRRRHGRHRLHHQPTRRDHAQQRADQHPHAGGGADSTA